ncbi:MAG TPA: chemotaxis protein CheW [candidate division Zixibacteria bacterium]|nr:chemotaxis protein CheW [candidate division Zixibacteria bacterium]
MSFPEKPDASPVRLLLFTLDDRKYALPLEAVREVVRAVGITPLPEAPAVVLGLIDVRGEIVAVFDPRERFRLPKRDVELGDRLILARASKRSVALLVDGVAGVLETSPEEIVAAKTILSGLELVQGVVQLPDGLALIHDLDRFLSADEERRLDEALGRPGSEASHG